MSDNELRLVQAARELADNLNIELGDEFEEKVGNKPRLILDPKRWSYQDYANFLSAYLKQQWDVALSYIMLIVVSWTYDVPIGKDAYMELPFTELPEIAKTVMSTLEAYIEGIDVTAAKTDMTRWTMRDFFTFRDAAKAGNIEEMETLMRKVVRLPEKPGKRLTFEQGALMSKAITEATKGMFAKGK